MIRLKNNKRVFPSITVTALIICNIIGCQDNREIAIVERINISDENNQLIIQLAELKVDSSQIEIYLEFLKEEIQTSVDKEPGVLTLYAMKEKGNPNNITIVEIYTDQETYESHTTSPHFRKYRNGTIGMVDSLKLTRMNPIIFASKPK